MSVWTRICAIFPCKSGRHVVTINERDLKKKQDVSVEQADASCFVSWVDDLLGVTVYRLVCEQ